LADPDKRWGWVIYQLNLRGKTLVDAARAGQVNPSTLYQVKYRRYPRMERLLAAAVEVPVDKLFPDRYDRHGIPLRRTVARSATGRNRRRVRGKR